MSIDEKKFMFKALIIGELLDTPLDAFGLQVGDTAEGFLCKKFAQDGELITVLQIPISGTQICEAIVDLETARALTEFVETVSNNEPKKRAIPQNPKSPSPLRAIFQTNSGEKIEITLKKGKDNFPIATADNGDTYEPQDGILLTNANRRILEYGEKGGYTVKITSPIAAMRLKHGLTQEELAKKTGIGIASLKCMETGKRNASVTSLKQIAQALGCSPKDLMDDD